MEHPLSSSPHPSALPIREEAEALLAWAEQSNPGPWADHSRTAARVAETIADACGLDTQTAYVLGLLHDIGRYEGVRGLHHVYAGYRLMAENGYDAVARVCLTHSFSHQCLGAYCGGNWDCTENEIAQLRAELAAIEYDEYDKLIQLCDALSLPGGACLLEVRLVDVARRHGFNEYTLDKWNATLEIKAHFDRACGGNLYALFQEELVRAIL